MKLWDSSCRNDWEGGSSSVILEGRTARRVYVRGQRAYIVSTQHKNYMALFSLLSDFYLNHL